MKIVNEAISIDGIDKIILRELMEDARRPILEIARKVGISGAAIHQRLRKLESSGLISGSRFIIDPKILGYTTTAFVGIYLDRAMSQPQGGKATGRNTRSAGMPLHHWELVYFYKNVVQK